MQIHSANKRRNLLPQLGALALAMLASIACSTGTRVPVQSGVAVLHAETHPTCADLTVSSSPMGVSQVARVQVTACGVQTNYICKTDSLPENNLLDHTRAHCALSNSLRGAAIRTIERTEQRAQNDKAPQHQRIQFASDQARTPRPRGPAPSN